MGSEEKMALHVKRTQEALSEWRAGAEKLTTPAALKLAMGRVLAEASTVQASLDVVKKDTAERRHRAMCRIYAREGLPLVTKLEGAMTLAEDAEAPFLTGIEDQKGPEAREAVEACEKEAAVVQKVLEEMSAWLEPRSADIFELGGVSRGDAASRAAREAFKDLETRVTAVETKLAQFIG